MVKMSFNQKEKTDLISFLSSVDEVELEHILEKFYFAFRNEPKEKKSAFGTISESFFSTIFSEKKRRTAEYDFEKDMFGKDVDLLKYMEAFRAKGRKSKVASEYYKKYHPMCVDLHERGYGARAISNLLKKKFKFKISHTYLSVLLKKAPY